MQGYMGEALRSVRRQKSKGKAQATAFTGVSMGKARQGRVTSLGLTG